MVLNHTVNVHRGKVRITLSLAELLLMSAFEGCAITLARYQIRSGSTLQFGKAAAMIVMRVAVEQILYIVHAEAKLRDILLDLGSGLWKAAVDQDVALGRYNQE